jgi:hypothetical protein
MDASTATSAVAGCLYSVAAALAPDRADVGPDVAAHLRYASDVVEVVEVVETLWGARSLRAL